MAGITGIKNLSIFLRSNYDIKDFRNIGSFYTDVLGVWQKVKYDRCDTVEDIINQSLLYNKYIQIDGKCITNGNLIDIGITKIHHIISDNNTLLTHQQVKDKGGNLDFIKWLGIIKAIPKEWKTIIQNTERVEENIDDNYGMLVKIKEEIITLDEALKAKKIYSHFINQKMDRSKANTTYSNKYKLNKDEWKKIYLLPFELNVYNKSKELQYKILHKYVATNKLLFKIGKVDSARCNFCFLYEQDIEHIMYDCIYVRNFWFKVEDLLKETFHIQVCFNKENILFGYMEDQNQFYKTINILILKGKKYIMECKYNNNNIIFERFQF